MVGPERDEGDESVPSPVGGEGLGQEVAGGGVMKRRTRGHLSRKSRWSEGHTGGAAGAPVRQGEGVAQAQASHNGLPRM